MKNRTLLAKKLEIFYNDIKSKRSGKMRLQTDLEFNQNKIKELNKKFDVDMFHTRLYGGKAFAAEQKIRELKKILLRSKRFKKLRKKRIRPNELIRKAVQNMNETISTNMLLPMKQQKKEFLIKNMVLISIKFMILLDCEKLKKTK